MESIKEIIQYKIESTERAMDRCKTEFVAGMLNGKECTDAISRYKHGEAQVEVLKWVIFRIDNPDL